MARISLLNNIKVELLMSNEENQVRKQLTRYSIVYSKHPIKIREGLELHSQSCFAYSPKNNMFKLLNYSIKETIYVSMKEDEYDVYIY